MNSGNFRTGSKGEKGKDEKRGGLGNNRAVLRLQKGTRKMPPVVFAGGKTNHTATKVFGGEGKQVAGEGFVRES